MKYISKENEKQLVEMVSGTFGDRSIAKMKNFLEDINVNPKALPSDINLQLQEDIVFRGGEIGLINLLELGVNVNSKILEKAAQDKKMPNTVEIIKNYPEIMNCQLFIEELNEYLEFKNGVDKLQGKI